MSDNTLIVKGKGDTSDLEVVGFAKDAKEAKAFLRDCEPGVYTILRRVEVGLEVRPPRASTRNVLAKGETVRRRKKAE